MGFDAERYDREVLEPARRGGNILPEDLLTRYALDAGALAEPHAFKARLDQVVRHWRALQGRKTYAKLATALLASHEELERAGDLAPETLRERAEERRRRARARLDERAAWLAGAYSCVSKAMVARLAVSPDGTLDEAMVHEALRKHGVRVVEPVELPAAPPTPRYRELRASLGVLGLRLSVEAIFGDKVRKGFRVLGGFQLIASGRRLTRERLERARMELDRIAIGDRQTALNNVLTVLLSESERPGALDALLLWELVEVLRPSAEADLPQRVLASELADLGLDRDEADVLSLSLQEIKQDRRHGTALREIQEALTDGKLRAAQRLAAALPRDGHTLELLERLEAAAAEVAAWSAKAERARGAGRTEEAAELLARALRLADDDKDLQRRYHSLPPPPATEARASVEGDKVTVTWRPSPARTGTVRYRVVRGSGRAVTAIGQGTALGDTEGTELVDRDPPVAESLRYSVFATRSGQVWSAPVASAAVVVLPEVADLHVVASERAVTASWRRHPRATGMAVARTEGRPPRAHVDGQAVAGVAAAGFHDTAVRTGVTYHYRVSAVYVTPDGTQHVTPGLIATVSTEAAPEPVHDLRVAVVADREPLVLQAAWTQPGHGQVSVWESDSAPRHKLDTILPATEVAQLGRQLPGMAERLPSGEARLTVAANLVRGRCFLTAVTVNGQRAAVGNTVVLSLMTPVRALSAERLDDTVRLAWIWPEGSTSARVRWWRQGGTRRKLLGAAECSRRSYDERGGFEVTVGPEAVTMTVEAVVEEPDGQLTSVPSQVEVEAIGPRVRYGFRRDWRRRQRRVLVVETDTSCILPALVVVQRAGVTIPLGPDQGEVVQRVHERPLDPWAPLRIELDLLPIRPSRLGCFFADSRASGMTLVPPPADQLKVG